LSVKYGVDGDAVGGEEGPGVVPEPGAGDALLVVEHLTERKPGVGIDG
jgi:hypothetical protein